MNKFNLTLAVVLVTTALADTAMAHSDLKSSKPAADATIAAPPDSLELTFSDRVNLRFSQVS